MLNTQVHRSSRLEPSRPGAGRMDPGVTAYVADTHVLVVVSKATAKTGSAR